MARQLSVAGDIEFLRFPSWCMYLLLDKIIGTHEWVALKRKCDAVRFYASDFSKPYKKLFSGSQSEGFAFSSSDVDTMVINENIVVQESIHNIHLTNDNRTVLLMTREGCNPGFVILHLISGINNSDIRQSIKEYLGIPVVSSILYRDVNRVPEFKEEGHGPCNTHHFLLDVDVAWCFECNSWPKEATEFIYRRRPYGWPQKPLLDKIICRGCHVVPIGDKDSHLTHIQWRLSFSAAEKDLVHSFNHTQFLIYGLLKIFLKQFIAKFQFLDDLLCSYFLKTAMFYCIESTPSLLWREDLLIPCFWVCLNKLITWVEQGYCPNYFVPQNNMFRNKVVGEKKSKLLEVLILFKQVGWTSLFLCEDFRELRSVVSYPELSNNYSLILSKKNSETFLDIIVAKLRTDEFSGNDEETRIAIAQSVTLLCHSRTRQEEEISTIILYNVLRCIGRSNICIDERANNKSKYRTLRKCHRSLLASLGHIGYVGMLDIATFYHQIGQYRKAIHILERVIQTWKPYVVYSSDYYGIPYHTDQYQRYICGRGKSLIEKISMGFVSDISIDDEQFHVAELCHDINAVAPSPVLLPPLPYTVFLLFLCYHKLGNIDRYLSILHDLKELACDGIQGGRPYPIVNNMLAICLDKVGKWRAAEKMCRLSYRLNPDENGALELLKHISSRL